jgi:hypothetical protein
MKKFLSAFRLLLAATILATFATSCKDKEAGVNFNPDFSINLMAIGEKWPPKKGKTKLKDNQQAAFEKFGRPDFLRILWNRQGTIMIRDQFNAADKARMKKAPTMESSWVYLNRGVEVIFTPQGTVERRINDEVRLIARMGDPEAVRTVGNGMTEWTFYSTGRIIKMLNGQIVETREFPAMSGFMK